MEGSLVSFAFAVNDEFILLSLSVETRSVDATIANILEGRVRFEPIPTLHDSFARPPPAATQKQVKTPSKMKAKFSLQEGMKTFEERKKAILDQARR